MSAAMNGITGATRKVGRTLIFLDLSEALGQPCRRRLQSRAGDAADRRTDLLSGWTQRPCQSLYLGRFKTTYHACGPSQNEMKTNIETSRFSRNQSIEATVGTKIKPKIAPGTSNASVPRMARRIRSVSRGDSFPLTSPKPSLVSMIASQAAVMPQAADARICNIAIGLANGQRRMERGCSCADGAEDRRSTGNRRERTCGGEGESLSERTNCSTLERTSSNVSEADWATWVETLDEQATHGTRSTANYRSACCRTDQPAANNTGSEAAAHGPETSSSDNSACEPPSCKSAIGCSVRCYQSSHARPNKRNDSTIRVE